MTRINPAAWVNIGGQDVTSTPGNPMALDDLEVTWGRNPAAYSQPDPATARVTLWDPSGTWGTRTDSRGQTDVLGAVGDLGWWEPAGPAHVMFRGRVTSLTTQPGARGGVRGAYVTVTLVDRLADLQQRTNAAEWPRETVTQRRDRLMADLPGLTAGAVTGIDLESNTTTSSPSGGIMRWRAAGDRTWWQGILDVAATEPSDAGIVAYQPDTARIRVLPRHKFFQVSMTRLERATAGDRVGQGAYITTLGWPAQPATGSATYYRGAVPSMWLDADDLLAPDGSWLTRSVEARLTRVDTGFWTDPFTTGSPSVPDYTRTASVVTVNPIAGRSGSVAERVARIDTEYATNGGTYFVATNTLNGWAQGEGSLPTPAPVVLDTGRTGGFQSLEQAKHLLAGGEQWAPIFIQRSVYPDLGVMPLFALTGGTIGHTDGNWVLTLSLAPVWNLAGNQGNAFNPMQVSTDPVMYRMAWEDIDAGQADPNRLYVYTDGLPHTDGLHESVTCEDLALLNQGLNGFVNDPTNAAKAYRGLANTP